MSKIDQTKINQGGLMRCCIDTICTLDENAEFENGIVIDCKYEKEGNQNIVLLDGVWRWNNVATSNERMLEERE
jgi:hypothetical protein